MIGLLFSLTVYTQEENQTIKNSEIGVSIGAAVPTGDFADDNANRSRAGLASTGYLLQINYNYKLTESFGFMALLRHQNHKVEPDPIAEAMGQFPQSYFIINTTNWKINSYMIGAFASLPINPNKNFYLDFMLAGGITSSTTPSFSIDISNHAVSGSSYQESAKGKGFGLMGGMQLKYYLNDEIGLSFSTDFLTSSHEYEKITVSGKNNLNQYESKKFDTDQTITSFNLKAGILFLL